MRVLPQATLLPREKIDTLRWDAACARDANTQPYGTSWWLDAVTDRHWQGIILDDYRVVLPIHTLRRVGPLCQIAPPPFTQIAGPWGDLQPHDVPTLLSEIPAGTVRLKLRLRDGALTGGLSGQYRIRRRTNYVLRLVADYEEQRRGYSRTLRRRLRRAGPTRLRPVDPADAVTLYLKSSGVKAGLGKAQIAAVRRLSAALTDEGAVQYLGVENATGQLLAAGAFPRHRRRLINLLPGATELGYAQDGALRLLDKLIESNLGDCDLLDFEGSELPGVAWFFRLFGPDRLEYLQLTRGL